MIALFYFAGLIAVSCYAVCYGGFEGRAISAIISGLFGLSVVVTMMAPTYQFYVLMGFAISCLSLALKCWVAMVSSRRWPIIIAAFQLNIVCAQISMFIAPQFKTMYHYAMVTIWAAPTLLILALGVYLDRQHDLQ